jgi:hypothetical protein
MNQFVTDLVKKLKESFNKLFDIVFTRSIEIADTLILAFKKQISTPSGALSFIIIGILILEIIGFSIIGVNLDKIKAFIAIIQPIIGWIVAIIAIIVFWLVKK